MSTHPLPYRKYPATQNKGGAPYPDFPDRGGTIGRPPTRQQRGYGEDYDDGFRGRDGTGFGIGNDDPRNLRGEDFSRSRQYQLGPSRQGQYRDMPPRHPEMRKAQTFAGEPRYNEQRPSENYNGRGLSQNASQKQRRPMQALDLASKPESLNQRRAGAQDYNALVSPMHDRFRNYLRSGNDHDERRDHHQRSPLFQDREMLRGRGYEMHPAQKVMQPSSKRDILSRAKSAPPDDPRNNEQVRDGGDQYRYPSRWPLQHQNGYGPLPSYRDPDPVGVRNDKTYRPPNGTVFSPKPGRQTQDENVPRRRSDDRTQDTAYFPLGAKQLYDNRARTNNDGMISSTKRQFFENGNGNTVRGASFDPVHPWSSRRQRSSQDSGSGSSHITPVQPGLGNSGAYALSGSHSREIGTRRPGSVDDLSGDYLGGSESPEVERSLANMRVDDHAHRRMGFRSERRDNRKIEAPQLGYERGAQVYDRRDGHGREDPVVEDRRAAGGGQSQLPLMLGKPTVPRMGSMPAPGSRDIHTQPPRPGINTAMVTQATTDTNANPNALPYHPPPFRANSESPVNSPGDARRPFSSENIVSETQDGARILKSAPGADNEPLKGAPKRGEKMTSARLEEERKAIANNPTNPEIRMDFAKSLLEASIVLAGEDGMADPKKTARNRDMYIAEAQKIVKKLASVGSTGPGKPPYLAAVFFLATCHGDGNMGMHVDHEKAFNLYHSAAKQGHSASCYRTAMCCEMGVGTRRDPTKAMQFYRKAASLGDIGSMYKLGMIMLRGLLGLPQNTREAMTWLTKAADNADEENPYAVHTLATLYERPDESIAGTISADPAKALELYTKAAHLGHAPAQFRLGCAYEYGQLGCSVDSRKSIAWYSRAAAAGEPDSELSLSGWYLTGAEGVLAQSDHEAYLWARKAADHGLAKAEFAVGYYVETGIGTDKDITEAKKWYLRAAEQGQKRAMARLAELKKVPQISGGGGSAGAAGNGGREKQALQKHRGEGKGGKDADCSVM